MQINKTDRNDAEGLAQIMRTGCYGAVHVKSFEAHRARSLLAARLQLVETATRLSNHIRGVFIADGNAMSGYSYYVQDGRLVHDMNVGGEHVIVRSEVSIPATGAHRLGVRVRRLSHIENPTPATGPGLRVSPR